MEMVLPCSPLSLLAASQLEVRLFGDKRGAPVSYTPEKEATLFISKILFQPLVLGTRCLSWEPGSVLITAFDCLAHFQRRKPG